MEGPDPLDLKGRSHASFSTTEPGPNRTEVGPNQVLGPVSLIAKQVKKRSTKQVAAPITAQTRLSLDEVVVVLEEIVRETTERAERRSAEARAKARTKRGLSKIIYNGLDAPHHHLHLAEHSDGWTISYPSAITTKVKPASGRWVARIQIRPRPAGGCSVTCELLHWVEKDGALANKEAYLRLLDRLAQRLPH